MRSTLLILTPGFAKDENDTTCIPLSQSLIKAINKLDPDLEVIIISLDFPFTSKEYSWFGNRVIPLNGTKMFRPLLWLKLYRSLKRLSKEKKLAGALNLWCADNAMISQMVFKKTNTSCYTWLQGQDARKGNKVLQLFKPKAEKIFALSDQQKKEFECNYHIAPSRVIYPGIDENAFASTTIERPTDVIGVGSLTPLKQYSVFIDVIETLKKKFPAIRAILIGDGPEKKMLQQRIAEKGLEKNIEIKGSLSHADSIEAMKQCKLLVHPSSYEGYGMVCLEALAAGCYVSSFVAPEDRQIEHWHIAKDAKEMITFADDILSAPAGSFYPVIHRKINDTASEILSLFNRL